MDLVDTAVGDGAVHVGVWCHCVFAGCTRSVRLPLKETKWTT